MGALQDELDKIERDVLVDDVVHLIDQEVQDKGGLTGAALKAGYRAVKKMKSGRMVEDAVDGLLDEFTAALDPLYESYLEDDADDFETYLDNHQQEATDALLSITDDRAEQTDQKFLRKTYNKLRGQAEQHVTQALPRVGALVDRHTAGKG
jgi:hypothetical protein